MPGKEEEKRILVKDIREGEPVQGTFAVRSKDAPRDYRSKAGRFFFMEVGDRTGDIGVKFWGGKDPELTMEIFKSVKPGDVIFLTGMAQNDKFEDRLVISIDEETNVLRPTSSEIRLEDFLPMSTMDLDELMECVMKAIDTIEEPHLRALLGSFFDDEGFVNEFRRLPSAVVHHHNYIGGNLEHTVGVLKVCEALCSTYPELDRDLLVTGALLHDVGKLRTYTYSTFIDITDEGKFMSHSVLGERMVREKMDGVEGFPKELDMKLSHMILKHMGRWEDVGPKGIRTLEALALHLADNCDAQLKEFLQEVKKGRDSGSGDWFYSRTFKGPIYLK